VFNLAIFAEAAYVSDRDEGEVSMFSDLPLIYEVPVTEGLAPVNEVNKDTFISLPSFIYASAVKSRTPVPATLQDTV